MILKSEIMKPVLLRHNKYLLQSNIYLRLSLVIFLLLFLPYHYFRFMRTNSAYNATLLKNVLKVIITREWAKNKNQNIRNLMISRALNFKIKLSGSSFTGNRFRFSVTIWFWQESFNDFRIFQLTYWPRFLEVKGQSLSEVLL